MDHAGDGRQHCPPLRLSLLGGFRAERDGRALPDAAWPRRSAKALVKLLATTPDHRLHREQILDLLWPDLLPDAAANALRKALHLARHTLEPDLPPRGESAYLLVRDGVVMLSPDAVWVDADQFQRAADTALASGDAQELERALVLYSGDFLPEDRYEDWAEARRAALADLRQALLAASAAREEERGRIPVATERLRQLLELDASNEEVHRRLMRLYALDGQRHLALRQYRACREALRRDLDADPVPATEALYQQILSGGVAPATAPVGQPPRPLPAAARRLTADPLVGRERQLALLFETSRDAAAGAGRAVLVGGEAGVGKSRLVAEVAQAAYDRGALVLWGACYEQEGHLPYGPLVEALDGAIAGHSGETRDHFAAAYPELAPLLPSLHRAGATTASERPEATRTRLFASVVRLLDELAGGRPLLLVLDDLHAADPASLQLLHHLARMAGERRWLILGTFREADVAAGSEFQRLCAVAVREGLCRRIDLERLSRASSDRLVQALLPEGAVPEDLLERLYTRSLGNPLYLQELLRAMRERDELTLDGERWVVTGDADTAVPWQIHALIAARVDRLGSEVRRALALVAAAGETCSFRILRGAGELPESHLLDALDRALEAQLLEERGDGYAFRHPLVGATLYERLSPPRRVLLHAALARAIEHRVDQAPHERAESVEALAHHWAAAGEPARAIPYLIEAADRAAHVYAHLDASARLRRALALLDGMSGTLPEHREQRAAILERLADLHALLGEAELATDRYLDAATVIGLEARASAPLQRKAAQQALFRGNLGEAERLLGQTGALLGSRGAPPEGDLQWTRLLIVRAQHHFLARRFAEALVTAEEALRHAEAAASSADIAQACEMAAMACLPLGEWRRGLDFEHRHAALADPNQAIRDAADVHICLSDYHLYLEQPAAAAQTFLQTLDEAERAGAPRSLALCHYYLGTMAYLRGRFTDSIAHQSEAIALYRRVGSDSGEAIALVIRGLAQTALGRVDTGRGDLLSAVEAAQQGTLRSHGLIRVYAGLGRHFLEAQDPSSARQYAELGLALAEEPDSCICYASVYPVAAAAFAFTGDLGQATALGERARIHAEALRSPFFLCMASQATATVHALSGAWDAAFAALTDAQRRAEASDFPYEQGRTLHLRALVHELRRTPADLEAAQTLAAQAQPILQRLGVPASPA